MPGPSDYLLSIMAVFQDKATGELKQFSSGLDNVGRQAQKAKPKVANIGTSLKAFAATAAIGVGAALAVGTAMKKAFDLGKEGAAIQQTEESFAGLIDKLGVTPDLLRDLQDASGDTISDMRLMSSTTTLLAGAQGDLAKELAGATPELLEIARAANKLNPTLGDTTFLYNSLATGIKRASPLILDNLGLTIKLGQANEQYAESIGKTVEQLTAEEQKMALLAEVRRAGTVLIDQAGGAAGSATDDFARLEAATENIANAFKKALVPAVSAVASAFADVLTYYDRLNKLATEDAVAIREASESWEAYDKAMDAAAAEMGLMYDDMGNLIKRSYATGRSLRAMEDGIYRIIDGEKKLTREQFALERATESAAAITKVQVGAFYDIDVAAGLAALSLDGLRTAEEQAAIDAQNFTGSLEAANNSLAILMTQMRGAVGGEIQDYADTQDELAQKTDEIRAAILEEEAALAALGGRVDYSGAEAELGRLEAAFLDVEERMHALGPAGDRPWRAEDQMRKLEWEAVSVIGAIDETEEALGELQSQAGAWDAHTEKLAGLKEELVGIEEAMDNAAAANREAMNRIIFDLTLAQLKANEFTTEEAALARQLALDMGLIDQATADAMGNIGTVLATHAAGGPVGTAVERISRLAQGLGGLEKPVEKVSSVLDLAIVDVAGWQTAAIQSMEESFRTGSGLIQDEALTVSDVVEELTGGLAILGETDYDISLKIEEEKELIEAFGFMDSTTRFLARNHYIDFHIRTHGEWPGGPPGEPPTERPPGMQGGGVIPQTGIYFMHKDELVIPPTESRAVTQAAGPNQVTYGATNNFNLNVTSMREARGLIHEYRIMQALAGD